MSSRNRRWNGKHAGNHQTVIDAAWQFLPAILKDDSIVKISPGFISGGKSSTARNSIKISDGIGSLLISIRGGSAHQEIRVFTKDALKAKEVIAQAALDAQFHVSYGNKI